MSLACESDRTQIGAAILFVGAPSSMSGLLRESLSHSDTSVDLARSFSEARDRLRHRAYSLVVCSQPSSSERGMEFLAHLSRSHPDVPCLFSSRPLDVLRFGGLLEPEWSAWDRDPLPQSLISVPVLGGTIRALVAALDARDPCNAQHSYRVTLLALRLGQALGYHGPELEALELAALLHDVGKLAVPSKILGKPGSLDEGEWELIKQHPVYSAQIVMQVGALAEIAAIVRHHHERMDGRGYPDALAGDAIPPMSRLICIVDAYEAMTASRSYRAAMDVDAARTIIRGGLGSQFDERMGEVFLSLGDLP